MTNEWRVKNAEGMSSHLRACASAISRSSLRGGNVFITASYTAKTRLKTGKEDSGARVSAKIRIPMLRAVKL